MEKTGDSTEFRCQRRWIERKNKKNTWKEKWHDDVSVCRNRNNNEIKTSERNAIHIFMLWVKWEQNEAKEISVYFHNWHSRIAYACRFMLTTIAYNVCVRWLSDLERLFALNFQQEFILWLNNPISIHPNACACRKSHKKFTIRIRIARGKEWMGNVFETTCERTNAEVCQRHVGWSFGVEQMSRC